MSYDDQNGGTAVVSTLHMYWCARDVPGTWYDVLVMYNIGLFQ